MMLKEPTRAEIREGRAVLINVRKRSRGLYWFVAIFSSFVNALMLTGPLYMLNVYNRVLGSQSLLPTTPQVHLITVLKLR